MEVRVYYRGSKPLLKWFLTSELPAILSGRKPDPFGISAACLSRVVKAALEDVHREYQEKSRGGGGDDGIPWVPLADSTIRRKLGRTGRAGVPGGPGTPGAFGPLDSQTQQTAKEIYWQEFRKLRSAGVPAREARRQASIISRFLTRSVWAARSAALGSGMVGHGGPSPGDAPILVERNRLLDSCSPGEVGGGFGWSYSPPNDDQRVELIRGGFEVHSDVPYGDFHMYDGWSHGFRPARPWKKSGGVPREWVRRWAQVYVDALAELLPEVVKQVPSFYGASGGRP